LPERGVVVVAVPPGFSPDWAMDDWWQQPRRLMCQVGKRGITYIVAFEGMTKPHLFHEKVLLPTGETSAEIKRVAATKGE
jgi:ATP sulfurylase